MDSTKENPVTDLEKDVTVKPVTFEWNSENNTALFADTITLTPNAFNAYGYVPSEHTTYTSSVWNPSSLTSPQTITTGTSAPWATVNPNTTSAKISLNGEGADVEVNGWSLVDAVKRIEQRLGLYQPNSELEAEWEDLRNLAEQYKKLEQHIKDKQATFDRIKAMPAPDID